METKFRPIPITILDILAIFLPGFVWLILVATAFEIFRYHGGETPTPVLAWDDIARFLKNAETWFAPFPLLVASLLLGYLLKPSAIVVTERLASQFVIRQRYSKEITESTQEMTEDEKGLWPLGSMKFPFDRIFKGTALYREVHDILKNKLVCSPKEFPGTQIFATAKSYLKVISPTMWEESERREAEVRMAGVMYLAFLFSSFLSAAVLVLAFVWHGDDKLSVAGWLILSAVGVIIAGESFSLLRVSEVGYTYMNMLVACKCSPPAGEGKGDL
jgi:hypothetical protein